MKITKGKDEFAFDCLKNVNLVGPFALLAASPAVRIDRILLYEAFMRVGDNFLTSVEAFNFLVSDYSTIKLKRKLQ